MSYAERPSTTLQTFDQNQGWKNSSEKILAVDFLSANGESNLLWTPFHYEEKDGRLFDPVREQFVAGIAGGDAVEEGVITQLEKWFTGNDSGLAVSISPRGQIINSHGDRDRPYPEEQLTLYRIGHALIINEDGSFKTKKTLHFSWHQFKKEFKNPEELRRFIFTENDSEESVFEIINWLKSVSEKPVSDDYGDINRRITQSEHYANLYKSGVNMPSLAYQMTQTKFLGDNPIGCPTPNRTQPYGYSSNKTETAQYYATTSETGWHNGTCRKCEEYTWVGGCNICQPCVDTYYS
jgi:hypothetical protein